MSMLIALLSDAEVAAATVTAFSAPADAAADLAVLVSAAAVVTVICFYTMLCICDKYLLCLVCIGFAYIIDILQDSYNTLFFNNHDNLFNRY